MRDKFVTSSLAVHSLPRALLSPTRLAPCHAFHAIATSMLTARNRAVANCAALALVMLVVLFADVAWAFTFEDVAQRAKTLAAASFKTIKNDLPAEVRDLTYDQYRDIRFKSDQALWRAARLPFEVAFFHQGLFFNDRIKVNELAADGVREIKFSPDLFDYGLNKLDPRKMADLGFAGFRVHYPLNTPKYKDEVVVFLGASYFRALGKGQLYGISVRGVAVDTALPSGEEFPHFVEFWLQRPTANASELTIYALLDSRRLSGAYRFVVKPGVQTAVDVKARLYLREGVGKLGLAPLTTMYSFGENQPAPRVDYRPEVHDSDGLSIQSSTGEWIWRPLVNPKRLLVTSFALTNPVGFGLMQRDRDFAHYEDLEARYDLRPSTWIEPKGQWGPGRVELVQIPSPDETNDNIVAYWLPDKNPPPKEPFDIEYRLLWQKDPDTRPPLAWVSQTRRGRGYFRTDDGSVGMVLDFDGPALKKLPADAKVEGIVSVDANGEVLELVTHRNDATGGWRLTLRLRRRDDNKPIELRAYLKTANTPSLSETWSYILPPN